MTDEAPLSPLKEEADAIAMMGLTHGGRLLHRYLRRVLEAVIDIPDDGALRSHNGRRSLARDLMRNLDLLHDDHRDTSDPAILSRAGSAVAVSGRGGRDPANYPRVDSFGPDRNPDGSDPAG